MECSDDDLRQDHRGGLDAASLLEALTAAGAAVDQAQIVGDVAAHRVVQVLAECADGTPPMITDIIGPPAVESERIAADIADAASRYENARVRHAGSVEDLTRAPNPDALTELENVAADSVRAEAEATALLECIDRAERRLVRRAAMPTPIATDLIRSPPGVRDAPSPPRLH